MKLIEPPFADPDAAARKIIELANAVEPVQDGRIHIEKINGPFLFQLKGTRAEYKAGLDLAIANFREVHAGGRGAVCLNRKGRPQYAERPAGLKIDANEKRPLPRTTYRRAIGQPAGDGIPRRDTETFMTLLFDYTRVLFVDEEEGPAR
jgi:hypothetical protein